MYVLREAWLLPSLADPVYTSVATVFTHPVLTYFLSIIDSSAYMKGKAFKTVSYLSFSVENKPSG